MRKNEPQPKQLQPPQRATMRAKEATETIMSDEIEAAIEKSSTRCRCLFDSKRQSYLDNCLFGSSCDDDEVRLD